MENKQTTKTKKLQPKPERKMGKIIKTLKEAKIDAKKNSIYMPE